VADFYNHYTTEFNQNWLTRIQQMPSKLAQYISTEEFDGEKKRYDRMNTVAVQERTMRNGPTPTQNVSTDSRWAKRKSFDIPAHLIDRDEAQNLGALTLPNSELIKQHGFAYNRKFDQQVLRTALGAVWTGTDGETSTAFSATYQIAHGSASLTIAKILQAKEIMDTAEVDEQSSPIMVVHPKQITSLLNITEVKSADYNTVKALAEGKVDTFCGFKFITSTQVAVSSTTYSCVAFHPSALRITRGGLVTSIKERADLSDSMQLYSYFRLAGTRVHDEAVIQIDCQNS